MEFELHGFRAGVRVVIGVEDGAGVGVTVTAMNMLQPQWAAMDIGVTVTAAVTVTITVPRFGLQLGLRCKFEDLGAVRLGLCA